MTGLGADHRRLITLIRKRLGVQADDHMRELTVRRRLEAHAAQGPFLSRNQITGAARLVAFAKRLECQHASISHIESLTDVPRAVASYLEQQNLTSSAAAISADPLISELDWGGIDLVTNSGDRDVAVSVTRAAAGISETGTLAFVSRAESRPVFNFVAETHIAIVAEADIVSSYESFWNRVRSDFGGMPETLNFVSGPSKTGDIEQTMYYGAHGPRRLHVIILERI